MEIYIATYFDDIRSTTSISSDLYNISSNNSYILNRNIILPNFYDLNNKKI